MNTRVADLHREWREPVELFGAASSGGHLPLSLQVRLIRTGAGKAELTQPSGRITGRALDMLRLIDQWEPIDEVVAKVKGAVLADAMYLRNLGAIRIAWIYPRDTHQSDADEFSDVMRSLLVLANDHLYALLTEQAKYRLGLIQGFRMILALERCEDQHQQQALAVRFVDEIWRVHGEDGVRSLKVALNRPR